MLQKISGDQDFYDIEKNGKLALKIFNVYYSAHDHSGKIHTDFPDFFLVKPEVLEGQRVSARSTEKAMIEDVIKRAKARNGFVGVSKHRNPKLGYYWLELSVLPFMLGDAITVDNKGEFFLLITRFVEFTRKNPKMYGDLTANVESDRDLMLMFNGINKMALRLKDTLQIYTEDKLLSFDPKWPVPQVKQLLHALKNNDQEWCELFFEYLIYVMSRKSSR